MIRYIPGLVGVAFTFVLMVSLYGTVSNYVAEPPEPTAEEEFHKEVGHGVRHVAVRK